MKKAYKHPATEVTSLELTDMILSGSGTPTAPLGDIPLNNISTDDQW